jgi:surface antigen
MRSKIVVRVALVCFGACFGLCTTASADPPDHAPAHGWRKKHDNQDERRHEGHFVGYTTGNRWDDDYEVSTGRCNREEVGAVLGAVAGGIVGSKVGSPDNRTVSTIIGVATGALIGARIGRELDERDRGCFGHTLEIARPGSRVSWENPATGVAYTLVPGEGHAESSGPCRTFTLEAAADNRRTKQQGKACQTARGIWKIM